MGKTYLYGDISVQLVGRKQRANITLQTSNTRFIFWKTFHIFENASTRTGPPPSAFKGLGASLAFPQRPAPTYQNKQNSYLHKYANLHCSKAGQLHTTCQVIETTAYLYRQQNSFQMHHDWKCRTYAADVVQCKLRSDDFLIYALCKWICIRDETILQI